jgi:hypothetical protein
MSRTFFNKKPINWLFFEVETVLDPVFIRFLFRSGVFLGYEQRKRGSRLGWEWTSIKAGPMWLVQIGTFCEAHEM